MYVGLIEKTLMYLPSLLGHTAELFRIIKKSPQPADALASTYFRSKKYIGSKERRFISELVFAALRAFSAAEHCAAAGWNALTDGERKQVQGAETAVRAAEAWEFVGIVAAALLLGERVGALESSDVLARIPNGDAIAADMEQGIAQAWAAVFRVADGVGTAWVAGALAAWEALDRDAMALLEKEQLADNDIILLATRCCVQPWQLRAWKDDAWHKRSWRETAALALSLLPSAPLCLRVNTVQMQRDEALQHLRDAGIESKAGALSPVAIVCQQRVDIRQLELTKAGVWEVQDEASQMVAYGIAPEETWRVLDACAGAGGKALHIAAVQHDKGEVIASDIEFKRLKEVAHRAHRAGTRSIRVVPLPPKSRGDALPNELAALRERCDAVIVDAPCSGMGTVRRMPLAKWRLTPEGAAKHAAKQRVVLQTYAQCVRSGGVLLYSTCSLMPVENDAVVQAFLAENPDFEAEPLQPALARAGVRVDGLDAQAATLTLAPATHHTDGFFLARLRRL